VPENPKHIKYVEIDEIGHVEHYWKAAKGEKATLCGLSEYDGYTPSAPSEERGCKFCISKMTLHDVTIENTLYYRKKPSEPLDPEPVIWQILRENRKPKYEEKPRFPDFGDFDMCFVFPRNA